MALEGLKIFKKGKVRDVYDLDEQLLMVATDRISCFDVILPTLIPDKGRILTQTSLFWFSYLDELVENHLICADTKKLPVSLQKFSEDLQGRFMITKKCDVVPFECVVRGYLAGSGQKEYQKSQSVCGIDLPSGLGESAKLPQVIFTPATKAESGHDENVSFKYMKSVIGEDLAEKLRKLSIDIYSKASAYAEQKGVIIADTKFEFGTLNGKIILIDEVLTPDSSRFWPQDAFVEGKSQASFDKQFVRDYLETLDWGKTAPAPELPEEIVSKTKDKYKQIYKMLVGKQFNS